MTSEKAERYTAKAELKIKKNKPHKAISLCERAIAEDPSFLNAYLAMGTAYLQLMDYENAISCLSKLLEFDPTDFRALVNLASVYDRWGCSVFEPPREKLQNLKEALRLYKKALESAEHSEYAQVGKIIDVERRIAELKLIGVK